MKKEIQKKMRRAASLMFTKYTVRLAITGLILLTTIYLYFFRKDVLLNFVGPGFFSSFGVREIVWCVMMVDMLIHFLPKAKIAMGARKSRPQHYTPPEEGYEIGDLYQYVQTMNLKAWTVMLVWLCFNGIFALLYLLNILTEAEMLLLSSFYIVSDSICILFYCPFQSLIMKNRCCANCRIFDWGHFMMFTPMLFIKSFFSWSLFFVSAVVLLRWELVYAKHPQRFWNGSNTAIRCENCTDKLCYIKRPLRDIYRNIRLKVNLPTEAYDEKYKN